MELELLFRALVLRGSVGLCEALAHELRARADEGVRPEACRMAAAAYDDAARALAEGRALGAPHVEAMRARAGARVRAACARLSP